MNHEETRERREKIAQYLIKGGSEQEAVAKFGLSIQTIWTIKKEAGLVRLENMRITKPRSLRMLRDLFDGMKPLAVATKHKVSLSLVCRLRDSAVANGWPELINNRKGKNHGQTHGTRNPKAT